MLQIAVSNAPRGEAKTAAIEPDSQWVDRPPAAQPHEGTKQQYGQVNAYVYLLIGDQSKRANNKVVAHIRIGDVK